MASNRVTIFIDVVVTDADHDKSERYNAAARAMFAARGFDLTGREHVVSLTAHEPGFRAACDEIERLVAATIAQDRIRAERRDPSTLPTPAGDAVALYRAQQRIAASLDTPAGPIATGGGS